MRNRVIQEQDDPPADDEDLQQEEGDRGDGEGDENKQSFEEEEGSLNISESNDSIHEMKKVTAIPILNNNDKFRSKMQKESGH